MFQRHPVQNEEMMFITTNINHRQKIFQEDPCARIAVDTLYSIQQYYPFFLFAFVIMSDHCHFLLRVPAPNSISNIMNVYKSGVSHNLGLGPIWQSRFDLKIPNQFSEIMRYIHLNPVQKNLATSPEEYPWSSASGRWDISDQW